MTPPRLVCPACRRADGGDLHVQLLAPVDDGVLGCACGARYPVIDGIPVVLRDLRGWLASEGHEALRRPDLPPACEALLVEGIGGAVARNDTLARVYGQSQEGPLQAWLRTRCAPLAGPLLELGAGLGVTGRADVVAIDTNLGMLRRHAGWRVCADALDPPLLPASFDTVVIANLLDSIRDPGLALAQADALLRPGGTLVTTCAYAFHEETVSPALRFTPESLVEALSNERPFGGYCVRHTIVEIADRVSWPLRLSDRTVHTHDVQAIISVKRAAAD